MRFDWFTSWVPGYLRTSGIHLHLFMARYQRIQRAIISVVIVFHSPSNWSEQWIMITPTKMFGILLSNKNPQIPNQPTLDCFTRTFTGYPQISISQFPKTLASSRFAPRKHSNVGSTGHWGTSSCHCCAKRWDQRCVPRRTRRSNRLAASPAARRRKNLWCHFQPGTGGFQIGGSMAWLENLQDCSIFNRRIFGFL